jgi:plastocyanin
MMQAKTFGKARVTALLLVGTLALAACGGGDEDAPADAAAGGDTATEQPNATSTITLLDNKYAPTDPVVAAGEVQLVNDGEAPHTFTIEGEDVDVEVEAGAEATAALDLEPGTYTLFCEFHRSQGMETTLTVE